MLKAAREIDALEKLRLIEIAAVPAHKPEYVEFIKKKYLHILGVGGHVPGTPANTRAVVLDPSTTAGRAVLRGAFRAIREAMT